MLKYSFIYFFYVTVLSLNIFAFNSHSQLTVVWFRISKSWLPILNHSLESTLLIHNSYLIFTTLKNKLVHFHLQKKAVLMLSCIHFANGLVCTTEWGGLSFLFGFKWNRIIGSLRDRLPAVSSCVSLVSEWRRICNSKVALR